MKMIRTFHPIGQGAFYSEVFISENGENSFCVVYDCGSGMLLEYPNEELISQIQDTEFPHNTIDILFLSHFHSDHINGVKVLSAKNAIKKIVIPLVKDTDLFVCKKEDNDEMHLFCEALKDPRSLLERSNNETKLIRVKPISDERNRDENLEPLDINEIQDDIEIESGTILSKSNLLWHYIPFNYEERSIKEALTENNLLDNKGNPDTNKMSEIIDVYKKFFGIKKSGREFNTNSLSVASIPSGYSFIERCCEFHHRYRRQFCNCFYTHCICCHPCGCMYFGDSDLKKDNYKLLNKVKAHSENIVDCIGTVQIPHHGSKDYFDDEMFLTFRNHTIDIISFGLKNIYNHPNPETVIRIIQTGNILIPVTQIPNSIYYECIFIK